MTRTGPVVATLLLAVLAACSSFGSSTAEDGGPGTAASAPDGGVVDATTDATPTDDGAPPPTPPPPPPPPCVADGPTNPSFMFRWCDPAPGKHSPALTAKNVPVVNDAFRFDGPGRVTYSFPVDVRQRVGFYAYFEEAGTAPLELAALTKGAPPANVVTTVTVTKVGDELRIVHTFPPGPPSPPQTVCAARVWCPIGVGLHLRPGATCPDQSSAALVYTSFPDKQSSDTGTSICVNDGGANLDLGVLGPPTGWRVRLAGLTHFQER